MKDLTSEKQGRPSTIKAKSDKCLTEHLCFLINRYIRFVTSHVASFFMMHLWLLVHNFRATVPMKLNAPDVLLSK